MTFKEVILALQTSEKKKCLPNQNPISPTNPIIF